MLPDMVGKNKVLVKHVWKFAFRILLLAAALLFYCLGNGSWLRDVCVSLPMQVGGEMRLCRLFYFFDSEKLHFPSLFQLGVGGVFLWIVWIHVVIGMLYRIFPNRSIAMGARKHFACSYKTTANANIEDMAGMRRRFNKGALLSIFGWFLITVVILLGLHFFGLLTPSAVLILMLVFAVLDIGFILFFCPFQTLFMRNFCCSTCRIYNWDFFMMCAPLIVFPSFFSISLVILSVVVFLRWEISLRKNPAFFLRETNVNLTCAKCDDKICKLRLLKK